MHVQMHVCCELVPLPFYQFEPRITIKTQITHPDQQYYVETLMYFNLSVRYMQSFCINIFQECYVLFSVSTNGPRRLQNPIPEPEKNSVVEYDRDNFYDYRSMSVIDLDDVIYNCETAMDVDNETSSS